MPGDGGRQARIDDGAVGSRPWSIAQDRTRPHGPRPTVAGDGTQLVALLGFAFVSSVTPGPNNVLLWASGATFGFRRTIPHVLGTASGIGAMALAAAAGVAALVAAVPALGVAMRSAGSAYLVWLAWQIWRSGELTAATVGAADEPGRAPPPSSSSTRRRGSSRSAP